MVRPFQQVFQFGFEQIGDVRDSGQHKSLVAAVNLLQPDMRIVDPDLATLADQVLQQRNHRTFAQVVGVFFERQTEYAEPCAWQIHHSLGRPPQVLVVARQDRLK